MNLPDAVAAPESGTCANSTITPLLSFGNSTTGFAMTCVFVGFVRVQLVPEHEKYVPAPRSLCAAPMPRMPLAPSTEGVLMLGPVVQPLGIDAASDES